MKRLLRQIYDDLSNGRLSKKDALEKIRALKLQEQGRTGALLVTPIWQTTGADASAGAAHVEYAEHHVVLGELPQVDAQKLALSFPLNHCLSLQSGQQNSIARRYE